MIIKLSKRAGTRIGDFIIDLADLYEKNADLSSLFTSNVFAEESLNSFMSYGNETSKKVRSIVQQLLSSSAPPASNLSLIPADTVTMHLPCAIGDYTDFYSSIYHATNVGIMFRGKENALMPNWKYIPIGYHGRASSIIPSGTEIKRPSGQRNVNPKDVQNPEIVFGPSKQLDFELEMAYLIGGGGNPLGTSIPIDEAHKYIFGAVLMNDWSARDIQAWEYVPLGPFLGKSFATTISPWIITMDALEPFLCQGLEQSNPVPLEYLKQDISKRAMDVSLSVEMKRIFFHC